MRHQPHLELADCRSIAAASHLAADQHQARVSIAVVDAGGHLLLLERRDGSSPASAEAAIAKARMAALNGKPTAALEASINGERPALLQLVPHSGQSILSMHPAKINKPTWFSHVFVALRIFLILKCLYHY